MATITEDHVSFETAKLLKEKGFPQDPNICNTAYTMKGKFSNNAKSFVFYYELIKPRTYTIAPTLQMACKWLRKNHQIFIRPNISFLYPIKWYSEIFCYGDNLKTQQDIKTEYYNSPEEACEAAIKYCLENLI